MRVLRSFAVFSLFSLLLMSVFLDEVEGRRKILRGRKTINRTYYKSAAIPAWSIIVIMAVVIIIIGGVLYAVMNRFVLGSVPENRRPLYQQ
ncbi:uncharacterized protein LOC132197195 [Neocloeon triangulifer]|uniref:uncharacterized protein LOC132197195 n=1 Tax=Neocloeon triangulifer TaxID=2078957 RepID=UPI00286F6C0D|nr:uncharacterized protein LOC132197195 [Neocloeon triangulifer]